MKDSVEPASCTSVDPIRRKKNNFQRLDAIWFVVLEYLQVRDYYVLGIVNHHWKEFLFENPLTEYLFRKDSKNGRQILKNEYYFQQAIKSTKCRKRPRKQAPPLNRLGVFSPSEEDRILFQDTIGYFGLGFLRPTVLAVWGNFSGVFLKDHSFQSTHEPSIIKDKTSDGYLFGDSNQVLAVHFGNLHLFLGFASGKIYSIDPNPVSHGSDTSTTPSIEYFHVSECLYHCQVGEISNLVPVEGTHLVSSCVRTRDQWPNHPTNKVGEILIHWKALQDGNLQNISKIDLRSTHFGESTTLHRAFPLLAMTYASEQLTIGTTTPQGDGVLARLVLWKRKDLFTREDPPSTLEPYSHSILKGWPKKRFNISFLKYFGNELVAGSSTGTLVRFRGRKIQVLNTCPRQKGAVEALELMEASKTPILITAGGYDGCIRFWDWETLAPLGERSIHPGHWKKKLYSPVIDVFFCHARSSLICLCRDGHLQEWNVEDEYHRSKGDDDSTKHTENRTQHAYATRSRTNR